MGLNFTRVGPISVIFLRTYNKIPEESEHLNYIINIPEGAMEEPIRKMFRLI